MIYRSVLIFLLVLQQVEQLFGATSAQIVGIPAPTNDLQVFALPVGQGDCTIIQCPLPNPNIVVFDCGSNGGNGMSSDKVTQWLSGNNGINRVKAIVVSHADIDHNNYLHEIPWNTESIMAVIVGGTDLKAYSSDMKDWIKVWQRAYKYYTVGPVGSYPPASCIGDCIVKIRGGLDFCANNNIKFTILAANVGHWQDPNEQSIVMRIAVTQGNQEWSMLLSGDIEGAASVQIANTLNPLILQSVVYKISHHGASSKANKYEWLNAIKPQSAFASSAYGFYYHPRCDTIARILLLGAITNAAPHDFYCGIGGGIGLTYSNNNNDGFRYNMWGTSPDETRVCILRYTPRNNFPDHACFVPQNEESQLNVTNNDADGDNDDDNDDDDDLESVDECDLPDGTDEDVSMAAEYL